MENKMTFNEWFCSLPEGRQAVLLEDKWMLAQAAFEAGEASERDACANVCKEVAESYRGGRYGKAAEVIGDNCSEFIRTRSNAEVSGYGTASAGLPG